MSPRGGTEQVTALGLAERPSSRFEVTQCGLLNDQLYIHSRHTASRVTFWDSFAAAYSIATRASVSSRQRAPCRLGSVSSSTASWKSLTAATMNRERVVSPTLRRGRK